MPSTGSHIGPHYQSYCHCVVVVLDNIIDSNIVAGAGLTVTRDSLTACHWPGPSPVLSIMVTVVIIIIKDNALKISRHICHYHYQKNCFLFVFSISYILRVSVSADINY